MIVRYVGPISDNSGYANAARNYIHALLTTDIKLTVSIHSFEAKNIRHEEIPVEIKARV